MKKLSFLAILLSGVLAACGQKLKEAQVPAAVKSAFAAKYPATAATWEKEDGNYEVNFSKDGKTMSAVIDKKGTILETETDIAISELPAPVSAYVKQHYKDAKIKAASKIVKSNGETVYEALVNHTDVLFDKNGKFLKEVKD
ncbi:MAG TPA: PepSY-like domain-containing protein [Chitinophagaceae bacterium]